MMRSDREMIVRRRGARIAGVLTVTLLAAACNPSSLVGVSDAPNTVVDPSQVETTSSAIELYNSAVGFMAYPLAVNNYGGVILAGGLLTDELQGTKNGGSFNDIDDTRNGFAQGGRGPQVYRAIHQARVQQLQARQALLVYAPNAPKAWQGQLYANEGFTILYFAENFCSGIPLTVVPLTGEQTPTRGFTTQELFTRAIAFFDSAIVAGADSSRFVNLARVGKARALLGLGEFVTADSVVQSVPTDFVYNVAFTRGGVFTNYLTATIARYRAQDGEGGNGLVWSTDPRPGIVVLSSRAGAMLWPAKYFPTSSGTLDPTVVGAPTPVRMADGLEARLIQAEAALAANDPRWLTILNTLRATCITMSPCAPVPTLTDANLPDTLTDPGTPDARLDLVMRERAMWLYMTGHREGDLRRLAHIYHRDPATLWPKGIVSAPAFSPLYRTALAVNGTLYGGDMVLSPDPTEVTRNSLYGGCYDRNP
jgi:hypothetical protein